MVERRTLLKAASGGVIGVPLAIGAGAKLTPVRPNLFDVRFDNRRTELVSVTVRVSADDKTELHSSLEVPPDEIVHLPCEWTRAVWSYEIAVRLPTQNNWQTATLDDDGRLCTKIVIEEKDSPCEITFYDSHPCPTTMESDNHSCS